MDNNTRPLVTFAAELRGVAEVLDKGKSAVLFTERFLAGLHSLHDRLREHVNLHGTTDESSLQAMVLRQDTPTDAATWMEAAQAIERMAFKPGWRGAVLGGSADKLLSIPDAAAKIGVSKTEIRRWIKKGVPTLPPRTAKVRGRQVRWSDLLAWNEGIHPKQKHQQRTRAFAD